MDFGIADDASFTDVAAAGFELRLDEDDGLRQRWRGGEYRGKKECCGDEGDIHYKQGQCGLAGFSECVGGEEASIGALDEADAGIIAELHGDLSEASVDSGYVGGSALQKTVSKATGGGADVETGSTSDVDFPVVERGLKFETASADEGHVVAEEADGGVGRDGSTGLVDFLFVDEDAAGKDEGASTFAALYQAPVNKEDVDADFGVYAQDSNSSSGSGVNGESANQFPGKSVMTFDRFVARYPCIYLFAQVPLYQRVDKSILKQGVFSHQLSHKDLESQDLAQSHVHPPRQSIRRFTLSGE